MLRKVQATDFPFDWVNLEYYPDSKGDKREIYSTPGIGNEPLLAMFHSLFSDIKNEILIYDRSWWDFNTDTWNLAEDKYDYSLDGKSQESQQYLRLLTNSEIEIGYSGSCKCADWGMVLPIILNCITTHQAPYSQLFYHKNYNFFFYFHHTNSIGLYYEHKNAGIELILERASRIKP